MRIEAHDHMGNVIKQDVTRVVVYDDMNNPIMVALKYAPRMCYVGKVGDADFQRVLTVLNIKDVVLVEQLPVEIVNENLKQAIF